MKLLDGEHQIPILSPNDISVFNGKTTELSTVKILVILRMRMTTNELAHIHNLRSIIAECKADRQVAHSGSVGNIQSVHVSASYIFFLILVLLTACFIMKNFTHLSMMFL